MRNTKGTLLKESLFKCSYLNPEFILFSEKQDKHTYSIYVTGCMKVSSVFSFNNPTNETLIIKLIFHWKFLENVSKFCVLNDRHPSAQ